MQVCNAIPFFHRLVFILPSFYSCLQIMKNGNTLKVHEKNVSLVEKNRTVAIFVLTVFAWFVISSYSSILYISPWIVLSLKEIDFIYKIYISIVVRWNMKGSAIFGAFLLDFVLKIFDYIDSFVNNLITQCGQQLWRWRWRWRHTINWFVLFSISRLIPSAWFSFQFQLLLHILSRTVCAVDPLSYSLRTNWTMPIPNFFSGQFLNGFSSSISIESFFFPSGWSYAIESCKIQRKEDDFGINSMRNSLSSYIILLRTWKRTHLHSLAHSHCNKM